MHAISKKYYSLTREGDEWLFYKESNQKRNECNVSKTMDSVCLTIRA